MAHAYYLENALRPYLREEPLNWLVSKLERVDFDGIAVRGMSGITIGSMLADRMKKELILVRKDEDNLNHSPQRVEMANSVKSYIIVDDLTGSGTTVGTIHAKLKAQGLVCRGIYLYRERVAHIENTMGLDIYHQVLPLYKEPENARQDSERYLRQDSVEPGEWQPVGGPIPTTAQLYAARPNIYAANGPLDASLAPPF